MHTCSYYCDRPECIRAQRDELRQKLEQAEKQKPSLWFAIGGDGRVKYTTDSDRALKWKQAGSYRLVRNYYTAPPKREWVGLTDEEMREAMRESQVGKPYKMDIPARCKVMEVTPIWSHISHFAELIEFKLRAKNCSSAD
jgi:hypothetical protein